jgi:DNA primase
MDFPIDCQAGWPVNVCRLVDLAPVPRQHCARAGASVSMPLRWEELGEELGQFYPTDFDLRTEPARLAAIGDVWAGILDTKLDLLATLS